MASLMEFLATPFGILVLTVANWPSLEPHVAEVGATVDAMQPGAFREWAPP